MSLSARKLGANARQAAETSVLLQLRTFPVCMVFYHCSAPDGVTITVSSPFAGRLLLPGQGLEPREDTCSTQAFCRSSSLSLFGVRTGRRLFQNQKPPPRINGGADRDRTGDLLTASQALSQLSYSPNGSRVLPHARRKGERRMQGQHASQRSGWSGG